VHVGYPNQSGWQPLGPSQPTYVPSPSTNGTAIAALILVFVFFPLGIILGHIARGQIKRTHQSGKGLATAALVLGNLPVVATVVVFVGAAVLVAFGVR
jgi:hypothetical protein